MMRPLVALLLLTLRSLTASEPHVVCRVWKYGGCDTGVTEEGKSWDPMWWLNTESALHSHTALIYSKMFPQVLILDADGAQVFGIFFFFGSHLKQPTLC